MKLRQLEIENYGLFSGAHFEFSETGFQLIHGPNEAGKSTLLQLIREVFFGFPSKTPYAFRDHQGEMAATASIELSDGRAVNFRRRKGNKNVVVGQVEGSDTKIDETALAAMLGQANARLYENIFGFSLAELTTGQESLTKANLNEALYGGGMGGLANFQQVQATLKNEHEQLYLPRGTSRTINKILKTIKATGTALNKSTVKPRDYKDICAAHDEAEAVMAELRERREVAQKRCHHANRLNKALFSWLRLADAKKELPTLLAPEGIAYDAEKEYRQILQNLDAISAELAEAAEEVAAGRSRLQQLRLEPQLLENEPAATIKSLERNLGRIAGCRGDLPKCSREAAAIRQSLAETVTRINPSWDLDFLGNFSASSVQTESVNRLADELQTRCADQKSLVQRQKEKNRELADVTDRLESLDKTSVAPDLEQISQNSGQYEADLRSLAENQDAMAVIAAEANDLGKRLTTSVDVSVESLATIPVPLEAKITEFTRRVSESRAALSQATANRDTSRLDLGDLRHRLDAMDAQQKVPDRDQLAQARRHRDAGWKLIRQTFIAGQQDVEATGRWLAKNSAASQDEITSQDTDPAKQLPQKFEQTINEADRLADQRQDKAELVAAREQLADDVERAANKLGELERLVESRQADDDGLQEEWQELWKPCGLLPDSPETMQQWLRLHDDYLQCARKLSLLESKRDELRQRTDSFERLLHEAMGDQKNSPQTLLRKAARQIELARDVEVERRMIEEKLPARRRELDEMAADLDALAQRCRAADTRRVELLEELGFPTSWDAQLAGKILIELSQARVKLGEAVSLERRVGEMQREIDEYECKVHEVCERLAPELLELPAEDAAARLARRLDEAGKAQNTYEELTKTITDTQRRADAKSTQQESLQQKLRHLRETAGVDSDDEFYRTAAVARAKIDLQKEIDELTRTVRQAAETEDLEAFEKCLIEADADTLRRDAQMAEEDLADVERQHEQAAKDVGAAQTELKRLDSRSEAVESAATLESQRAELRAAVDRWAPLVLAHSLMSAAIVRFESEHQPEMLQSVGELFSEMTLGRYCGIRRRLDDRNTLLVESPSGGVKEPSQLSTGTREQLYLAIRLAYVRHYCRDSEPLPLVMDDVLVNFDDRRAAATLEVLVKMAADLQVIFLTCHRQTAELIAGRVPEMKPIELA